MMHCEEAKSRELLDELRRRLQELHFAARGFDWASGATPRQALADQLHGIRVLAEELDHSLDH
jgi:hypothetical protein